MLRYHYDHSLAVSLFLGGEIRLERGGTVISAPTGAGPYPRCQYICMTCDKYAKVRTFSALSTLAGIGGELVLGGGLVASFTRPLAHVTKPVSHAGRNILHWRAGCLPQEQVASLAHTHSAPLLRPQQVMLIAGVE